MKNSLSSFIVGFIFALGLGISGMTQPSKVVGFLDLFGSWDPSLIFVMVGAILVHSIVYRFIKHKSSPLFSADWHLPTRKDLTPALIIGATLFGVGWGLGGYCPGPAVTSLASLQAKPAIFVGFMLIGMLIFRAIDKKFKIVK